MDTPDMSPDELAWAFQNAGRAPAAQQDTSQAFAAQARAREQAQASNLERQLAEEQRQQDLHYNRTIHAQDMAAAQAHHRALMGQYSLIDQVRGELGLLGGDMDGFDWKYGFAAGLVVGATLAVLFGWAKP